jgi:hypothetical protein
VTPFIHAVWESLPGLVESDQAVSRCMADTVARGRELRPGPWERFGSIDYDADAEGLRSWIPDALEQQPPGAPLVELAFGLTELDQRVIRLAGTPGFSSDDGDKSPDAQSYRPAAQYAAVPALVEITRISSDDFEMDWAMPLVFLLTTVRTILSPLSSVLLGSGSGDIAVSAGWDCGDWLELGHLTPEGFRPQVVLGA